MRGFLLDSTQWLDQIHQGDCLEIMRQLPDGSVDLVFTSPPYNIRAGSGGGRRNWEGYDGHADNLPHPKYVKWQRECLREMMRLIPETGAIFYNHCHRVQNGLLQSHLDILTGLPLRQVIIWHRSGGINHNPGYFLPDYEVIYLIAKPEFRLEKRDMAVWRIHQDSASWIPEIPTFPVELPLRAIRSTSAQVILDPFMGSGSTAVASKIESRRYIGIEQSVRYCQVARERVEASRPGENLPIPPSVYERVAALPKLGKSASLLYEYLKQALEAFDADRIPLTRPQIAADLECSVATIKRASNELVEAGLVEIQYHGRWCSYRLTRNDHPSVFNTPE